MARKQGAKGSLGFECVREVSRGFLETSYQQYIFKPSFSNCNSWHESNIFSHCIQTEEAVCSEDQYQCHEGDNCVSKTALCDGAPDCPHGDDENGCPTAAPADHEHVPAHNQHDAGNHEHVSGKLKHVQQEDVSTGVRTCTITLSLCVVCWLGLLSLHLL